MPFLNPWMLLGLAGVGVPVLIHLLNRHRVQVVDWAAMELLRKVVQVKSRQLRLQDILLMLLRCLAVLLIVLAAARPTTQAPLKSADAGVVIGIDGSYSMGHKPGLESRMDGALERVREILGTVTPGRPVTLVLMGERPRVLARNAGYDPAQIEQTLKQLRPLAEGLNLERCLSELKPLVKEIKSPQREVYLVTDAQAATWQGLSDAARNALSSLTALARVSLVDAQLEAARGQENLAIVRFELAGGAMRTGTVARYIAEVKNQGANSRDAGSIELLMDDVLVDKQPVGQITPGQTILVPLYAALTHEGMVRLTARLGLDELEVDNTRYAVAQVRRTARVLIVDGEPSDKPFGSSTDFLRAAISPQHAQHPDATLELTTMSWLGLAGMRLGDYDVVILANVPDVPEDGVGVLADFLERGGGLIVFLGDNVKSETINKRLIRNGKLLLPAELGTIDSDTSINAAGVSLDPALADDALISPLAGLPADLLTECRFVKWMKLNPRPQARVLLKLASRGDPMLVEQSYGRGQVLLCASTADRKWNNMAINPLYPILLQQAITRVTRTSAERALTVNEPLVLPLDSDQAGSAVKITDPAGQVHTVTATLRGGDVVVQWDDTALPGFYQVQAGADARVIPVAVNINPVESDVKTLSDTELNAAVAGVGIKVLAGGDNLKAAVREIRVGRELWNFLALAALALLLIETWVARRQTERNEKSEQPGLKRERSGKVLVNS